MIKKYKKLKQYIINGEWKMYCEYTVIDNKTQTELWVSSGWLFFNGYNSGVKIPFLYRLPLWIILHNKILDDLIEKGEKEKIK